MVESGVVKLRVGSETNSVGAVMASQCCKNKFIIILEVSVITTSPLFRNEEKLGNVFVNSVFVGYTRIVL